MPAKPDLDKQYQLEYAKLNPEQKQAVDTIDGPLLVVAGPGTGKTQLLSLRVANILRRTDSDASSILCLTFTNKAAINMQERLLKLVGQKASSVTIKTFHSFAAEIINQYPDYFWNGARLTIAPDASQLEIIQHILQKLPLKNPLALKFAGTFTAGRDVQKGLKLVKEAGLSPEKLRALVQANLAYIDVIEPELAKICAQPLSYKKLTQLQTAVNALPNQGINNSMAPLRDMGQVIKDSLAAAIDRDSGSNKTTNTGKWKKSLVQNINGKHCMFSERQRNEWWLALNDVYKSYRNKLHQQGYYDYSDMIIEVISQLENHSDMRAMVQEQFMYVLIDEFQDTNAAQLRLAQLVSDHPLAEGKPNLMAVGDDDQAIYKFNGAELNNMLSFKNSYPTTKTVVLSQNYRSNQQILNISQNIIEHAEDRLVKRQPELSKDLKATIKSLPSDKQSYTIYPTADHQLSAIADKIAEQWQSVGNQPANIAVLARSHTSLRKMAELLQARNIPLSYEQQNNVLQHSTLQLVLHIGQLTQAISCGDEPTINHLLSQVLRHPAWDIPAITLWELASTNRHNPQWLKFMLKSSNKQLKNIADWLLWLTKTAAYEPAPVILEYILGLRASQYLTSPIANYAQTQNPDKQTTSDHIRALSAIRLLQELTVSYSRTNQPTLDNFIDFLQLCLDSEQIIADESMFITGERPVHLMTVHKAKGLEFDTVYIIDVVDNSWKPVAGGRKPPLNLPLQPAGENADDYARLLFVAATRAKHNLFFSSFSQDTAGQPVAESPLMHGVVEPNFADKNSLPTKLAVLQESLAWPRLDQAVSKASLGAIIDNFHLTATSLLDFLDVTAGGPSYFFERHIMRLPTATTTHMAFGNSMHRALEIAQLFTNQGAKPKAVISSALDAFETSLKEQFLPQNDHLRYLKHGQDLLEHLLSSDTFWLAKGGLPEQSFSATLDGGVRLRGKLDRIDSTKESITISDYKTGKPLTSLYTKDRTKQVKAWRHRQQLLFYALLIQSSGRATNKEINTQIIYLEAASAKELIRGLKPTKEDLEQTSQTIKAVWQHINNASFPPTKNYSSDYNGILQFQKDIVNRLI